MNPKETGVIFDTENELDPLIRRPHRISGMAQLVMSLTGNVVTSERQANVVLLGFVIVALIFSYLLLFGPPSQPIEVIKSRDNISAKVRAKLPPGVWNTIPAKFK